MISTTMQPTELGLAATLTIAAPPAAVLAALTSPEAVTRWWVACDGTGEPGGRLTFHFGDQSMQADVAAADPSGVRWHVLFCEPLAEWDGTSIEFELEATEDGSATVLSFLHRGLRSSCECFGMCVEGWEQYLPSLVAYVEHGGGVAFGSEHDTRAQHWHDVRAGA